MTSWSTWSTYVQALVEKPPFLSKSFQLNDICNYVLTRFLKKLNKIMTITNYVDLFTILVYSWKHFSTTWSFVEYSQHQQCFQVELPIMLVNNVKHVSTKWSFLKYSWHLMFFSWHTIKTLTSVQLFWMIKCSRGWMKYNLVCNYLFQLG